MLPHPAALTTPSAAATSPVMPCGRQLSAFIFVVVAIAGSATVTLHSAARSLSLSLRSRPCRSQRAHVLSKSTRRFCGLFCSAFS